jgi:hypothetical protein
MGRRILSGPPDDEYQQPTAWRYPKLREDIRHQVRFYKPLVSLLDIDQAVATHLGIPADWVYLVRISEPLPDTIIPPGYWQRQPKLRAKGRPSPVALAPTTYIPLDYHYRYLTTQRPPRCVYIIACSHSQPHNRKPLPSPFLHPTTTNSATPTNAS